MGWIASADAVSFTIDALGRHASQTIGSNPTSTYAYLGISDSITTIANSAGTTYSTIDAIGDRLASGVGTAFGWIVPDLHGNVVAAIGPDATFVNALRFDPYGQTVATWTATSGSVKMPWRYQGRILESAGSGSSTDLYDFQARSYDPSLGGFTSLDSVAGSAQNPLTLNRYLYANANPATLVDPDGHCAGYGGCYRDAWTGGAGGESTCSHKVGGFCSTSSVISRSTAKHVANSKLRGGGYGGMAAASSGPTARAQAVARSIDDQWTDADIGMAAMQAIEISKHSCDGLGCLGSFAEGFTNGVLNMPGNTIRGLAALPTNPGAALEALSPMAPFQEAMGMAGQAQKGDWYSIGQTEGGQAASAALLVATMGAGEVVAGARAATAGADAATDATRLSEMEPLQLEGTAGVGCSFTAATVVATTSGSTAIAAIKVGQTVLAYDPKTGETGPHTVTAVMAHTDPVIEHLTTDTGSIDTTPNHLFFTADRGWLNAGSLLVGEQVRTDSGGSATILGFTLQATPTTMWDLTVDGAHSFFVGQGAVLVHNCAKGYVPPSGAPSPVSRFSVINDVVSAQEAAAEGSFESTAADESTATGLSTLQKGALIGGGGFLLWLLSQGFSGLGTNQRQ